MMNSLIESNKNELDALFVEHSVSKVYLFGSALKDDFSSDSDIDLLIDFKDEVGPEERGELWWSLFDRLRTVFDRDIDLVVSSSLKNPYFIREVNRTKRLIHG